MNTKTLLHTQRDRVTAIITALAAVVVLILGWYGVSGTAYPTEQLPYIISGGIGSLFLLGVSSALWLSADLNDEWRKLDRIERAILSAGANDGRIEDARPAPRASNEPAFEQNMSQQAAKHSAAAKRTQ
jgi:hypothetical protein